MKKSIITGLALIASIAILGGCSPTSNKEAAEGTTAASSQSAVTESESTVTDTSTKTPDTSATPLNIGSLKGPTSMGLVSMMENAGEEQYQFTMVTAADELLAMTASGQVDIALVPANVAAVLYQKTEGGISVLNINTLGVLNLVSADTSVQSLSDLKGKTVYMTGKGTVPDYVFQYLLKEHGMTADDITIEYKSEPAEVAALLQENKNAFGILPQPFATAATIQNPELQILIDLKDPWNELQTDSRMITGVTIVRNQVLQEREADVLQFMADHKASVTYAETNPAETAKLVVKTGIIEKAPVAEKALPYCNLVSIDGAEMKTALSGYLQVLFDQDPKSVGGKMPEDDFYYITK